MDILWIKLVHILGGVVIFGTGLGTAFHMWFAHLRGDPRTVAVVARNVVLADWLFTTPAVVLQPLTGVWLAVVLGYSLTETWLIAAITLYLLAGACWLPVVWLQMRMHRLAATAGAAGQPLPATYHRYAGWWFRLGWPAFIALLVIFYLMVFKDTGMP